MNNLKIPNEVIIIGGGPSIRNGLSLGLKDKIKDKFVITCNFAFNHFDSTFTTFVDQKFYQGQLQDEVKSNEITLEHIQKLKKLPLIIGNQFTLDPKYYYENTIPLHCCGSYNRDIKKGIYKATLVGLFSIHLAMYLMNYSGNIFLLGYDWTQKKTKEDKPITHYYSKKEINHRGHGRSSFYTAHKAERYFLPFEKEKDIAIYNVSLKSNINNFQKISYEEMFSLLTPHQYNQDSLRTSIKSKISVL